MKSSLRKEPPMIGEYRNAVQGVAWSSRTAERIWEAWQSRHGDQATIAGLRRQRDELHETANRYLERARQAEAELAELKFSVRRGQ